MHRRVQYLLLLFVTLTAFLAILRPLFMLGSLDIAGGLGMREWLLVSWYGLVMDLCAASWIMAIPFVAVVITIWLPQGQWLKWAMRGYFVLITALLSVAFGLDLLLYHVTGQRLTFDATALLSTAHLPVSAIVRTVFIIVACWVLSGVVMWFEVARCKNFEPVPHPKSALLGAVFVGAALWFGACAGSGSMPYAAHSYFTDDRFVNHATSNVVMSLGESSWNEPDFSLEHYFTGKADSVKSDTIKNDVKRRKIFKTSRPNIIIIVMNGISNDQFNRRVNDKFLMPELNTLSSDGYLFTRFYTSGGRRTDAVVSVIGSYPPMPHISPSHFSAKNEALPSLIRAVDTLGYSSEAFYGGSFVMHNIRPYLYSAGFERVTDRARLGWYKPSVEGIADDGAMFSLLSKHLETQSRPFCDLILTNSTIKPRRVPYALYDNSSENAVAFGDEQLGVFVRTLKYTQLWDSTVLVIVGQGTRRGEFAVPMLITGGAVNGAGVELSVASQKDIVPTLLGQMGVPSDSFVFGRDLFAGTPSERTFFTFGNGFGVATVGGAKLYYVTDKVPADSIERTDYEWGRAEVARLYRDFRNR